MAGRPKLRLDPVLVETLASKGCNDTEIALILTKVNGHTVSIDRLRQKCSKELEYGRAMMRRLLREAQIATAQGTKDRKPNAIMQIWLGKQLLGQADKVEATNRTLVKITAGETWESAFGTAPGRTLPVPKELVKEPKPSQTVQ